jgi:hypothetical protein
MRDSIKGRADMKWTAAAPLLAMFYASTGSAQAVRTHDTVPTPVFTIDFEREKSFQGVAHVQGTNFGLRQTGRKVRRGGLSLESVEKPTRSDGLSRAVEIVEIREKYGDLKGHFLSIDGLTERREAELSFDRKARFVTFDYVLSNSVRRTGPFERSFLCVYSSGETTRLAVIVANPTNLANRTRGKAACRAPENAYVKSIVFSNAKDGSYETWIDNVVGASAPASFPPRPATPGPRSTTTLLAGDPANR